MSDIMATYFGPLSKEYCLYFYVLSVFFGVVFVIAILALIFAMFRHFKKITPFMVFNMLSLLANILLAYFVNRLLYTMCVGSIH